MATAQPQTPRSQPGDGSLDDRAGGARATVEQESQDTTAGSVVPLPAPCRVAVVVRPATGGMRRHISDLLEHLDRRQFTPTLFAAKDFVPDRPLRDTARCSIDIGAATRPVRDYRTAGELAQLLRDNIDIVHAHGLRGAIIGGLAAQRAGLPYLFTVHNLLPRMNVLQSLIFRELARKAARVIAVSGAVANTLQSVGVERNKIAVIPNGVDSSRPGLQSGSAEFRAENGFSAEECILMGVGRLAPEKGFDVLIAAFALLQPRFPDIRLIIAGDGSEASVLRARAELVSPHIHFLGHTQETGRLFQTADIVIAPSRQEGQGIVPLEAMAASKPVVASRVGGLVETIVEGETGLLVPPDDAPALASALEKLLTDPAQRAALGAAGRKRVVQEYSLQTQIQKIEAIYRDVYRRTA